MNGPGPNRLLHSVLLCLTAVFAPTGHTEQLDSASAAQQLQNTVERLNALDQWFTEAQQQRAVWLVDIQQQDSQIAALSTQVASVSRQVEQITNQLQGLRTRIDTLEADKTTQAEHIAKHVAAAYRLTGQDFLKQLLNQESPDTLDRMWRYHRIFSESRLDVLADYRQTLTELDLSNRELDASLSQQQVERQRLQNEQTKLASERESRAELVAELDHEKESKAEEYARLERDRTRLENLLAELNRRRSQLDGSAFLAAKGGLPMPVAGRIRHAFGSPRADNRLRWQGIDIRAPESAPVTAVFRGRVIFADWLRGFGFLAIVDHGSEYMTLYGHVDALHKRVGDWVESGELIADAGNSGGRQESGLYFEVRHKGQALDPINWVLRP